MLISDLLSDRFFFHDQRSPTRQISNQQSTISNPSRPRNQLHATGVLPVGSSPGTLNKELGVIRKSMKNLVRFKTLAIASLSAIALTASIALAQTTQTDQNKDQSARPQWQGRGRGQHGWGGMRGGAFFRNLNLTDDQKTKLRQLHESFASSNKPLLGQLRAKRQELRQASEGGSFNEALATQKLTEMASLEAKLMGENFKLHQDMLAILTPEQKAQLEQQKAQFKTRRGERRDGQRNQQ
ncbi:MAG: hypothetical protein C5B55_12125 [Blastocatellia bacterium]|nr:MAG: hypothetical protein C5B55_12125 [Blastocatellia bacterium]